MKTQALRQSFELNVVSAVGFGVGHRAAIVLFLSKSVKLV
jgi:hypothetical protein